MLISILWLVVGGYFVFLGVEILFFKVTKRIPSLETYVYKNKKAFVFRLGLLQLIFGLGIIACSVIAILKYKQVLFTYTMFNQEREMGYNILPLGAGIISVLFIYLNQRLSIQNVDKIETKKEENETNEDEKSSN